MSNTQTVRYYVARINKNTGDRQHMQKMASYDGLFRTTPELSTANAYENAEDVGMIVNHLNAIMEHFNSPFYYFVIQNVDDSQVWTGGMPDDVRRWFEPEEEPEEEVPEEGEE